MADSLMDIVMLVHDQAAWADLAIRAVEHHTKNPYRLILVDMASQEEKTKRMLADAEKRGHTVVTLPDNISFSHGCNIGATVGSSKFICFLNDDAIVTEGWDGALMSSATPKHIGLVGARSNYASGAQMDPSFVGEPPYLVFVCVALRRDVWNAVGPLDEETFDGFSTEDIDYAWRVKKAGYQLAVSPAYVLHAGSRTLGPMIGGHTKIGEVSGVPLTEERRRNDQKYTQRLIDKWGKDHVRKYSQTTQNVLVATYHPNEWTRVDFMDAFVNLKAMGGYAFKFLRVKRVPIHFARNATADMLVDGGYDWLVQIDDDAVFPPDLIRRFLSHKKDVICALAYQRKPPHATCAFEMNEGQLTGNPLEGIEHTGLRRVDASGFHCSIISRTVIEKLRAAGIRQYHGGFDSKLGEDLAFSMNLKKIGVQMYVDTDLISGHIGDSIIVDEAYKRSYVESQRR